MTEKEIKDMLREMEPTNRVKIVQALMAVQDATEGFNNEEKMLVASMWAKNMLSYKRVLELIECGG